MKTTTILLAALALGTFALPARSQRLRLVAHDTLDVVGVALLRNARGVATHVLASDLHSGLYVLEIRARR